MNGIATGKSLHIKETGSGAESAAQKSLIRSKRDDRSKNAFEKELARADRNRKLGAILFFLLLALYVSMLLLLALFWEDFGLG